jgi:hypothetical protein
MILWEPSHEHQINASPGEMSRIGLPHAILPLEKKMSLRYVERDGGDITRRRHMANKLLRHEKDTSG